MRKVFIGYYLSILTKGRYKILQLVFAASMFLFALIPIPALIRFLSGSVINPFDFILILFIIYSLMNLVFVTMQKWDVFKKGLQPVTHKFPENDAIGETYNYKTMVHDEKK